MTDAALFPRPAPGNLSPQHSTRIYVHLSHGQDVADYARRYERGLAPDRTPYGFHLGANHGYDLSFSKDRQVGRISHFAARAIKKILGFDPIHAWYNRSAVAQSDVVWTMLEVEALAVACLMWLGLAPRRSLLGSTVWMINGWHRYGIARRWLYRRLVPYFSELLVHTQPCYDRARAIFPDAPVKLMYFGVAADTFGRIANPAASVVDEPIHIFAAGNDRTRDWQVLLDAFGNDPRFRLTIACQWLDRAVLQHYNNLILPENITMQMFRELYRSATYVAVPMYDNIFSGITVAIEAAAMEVPVLSTRTGGVPTYFDEQEVGYIEVGDAAGWRKAALERESDVRAEMARRAHARFLRDDYSTAGMIARYVSETEALPAL